VNDNEIVADASAILAVLKNEPFTKVDPTRLVGAIISAVNMCEVLSKLHDDGLTPAQADTAAARLELAVVAFDAAQAAVAAELRLKTRSRGLSLADRACLTLGRQLGCVVVTADRAWADLEVGVEVILIR
jgi:PIN domain nuclease of toxin-antitoxin system